MLVIDTREKVLPELARKMGISFIEDTLPVGDINCGGGLVIERKRIHDLWSTLTTSRIDQFPRLAISEDVKYPVLAIIGYPAQLEGINYNPEAIYGLISSLVVRYGYSILWLPNDETLLILANKISQKIEEGKLGLPERPMFKEVALKMMYILCCAVRVTPRLAADLLKKFKTLRNIANASMSDLMSVPGVGVTISENIYKLFNTPVGGENESDKKS